MMEKAETTVEVPSPRAELELGRPLGPAPDLWQAHGRVTTPAPAPMEALADHSARLWQPDRTVSQPRTLEMPADNTAIWHPDEAALPPRTMEMPTDNTAMWHPDEAALSPRTMESR